MILTEELKNNIDKAQKILMSGDTQQIAKMAKTDWFKELHFLTKVDNEEVKTFIAENLKKYGRHI